MHLAAAPGEKDKAMQTMLTEQNVKFITDSRGRKKEVILSYPKFRELQDLLDEILPDREYDLTDAIIEGVKEIGCIQREKSVAKMQTLGEFLDEL
ncbi:MAG: hypothetical protein B1H02_05055 [Candidatus Latescibacteria bacterium 4484_107]|nr:MAG: hypothetical protein B1H02_05055 [Candidatus Latescibacteria bacterium 4484_107]